jgi:hypothetical protein
MFVIDTKCDKVSAIYITDNLGGCNSWEIKNAMPLS